VTDERFDRLVRIAREYPEAAIEAALYPTRQERRAKRRKPKMIVNGASVKMLAQLIREPKRKKGRRA
jgi:hypothetical protein